jgi:hypothetical protein
MREVCVVTASVDLRNLAEALLGPISLLEDTSEALLRVMSPLASIIGMASFNILGLFQVALRVLGSLLLQ